MSDQSNLKIMSGWTMVNSQGEVVSGDEGSETSEASLEGEDVIYQSEASRGSGKRETADEEPICEDLTSVDQTVNGVVSKTTEMASQLNNVVEKDDILENNKNIPDVHDKQVSDNPLSLSVEEVSCPSALMISLCNEEACCPLRKETGYEDDVDPSVDELQFTCSSSFTPETAREHISNKQDDEESDAGLYHLIGACCSELLLEQNTSEKNQVDDAVVPVVETLESEDSNLPLNVICPPTYSPGVPGADEADSDSDSDDFVCLEPERQEEENVAVQERVQERDQGRVVIPLRVSRLSSSIGPDFNFMRNEVRRHESDDDDRDEDTESSTEDSIDDRIESEQSETGSNQYDNYDVGDLSSFDIGDIPLVVGNVARNYRHQPNTNLTNILNTIVVLSAILTMGISLGISVATDLEIEEWQRAHEMESEKVKTLEEQALTLEKLWNHYKRETKELEELVTIQDKREEVFYMMKMHASDKDKSFHFVLENLHEIRHSYQNCIVSKQLEPESCYSSISPSLARLKAAIVSYDQISGHDTQEGWKKSGDNQQQNPAQTENFDKAESSESVLLDTEKSGGSEVSEVEENGDAELTSSESDHKMEEQIEEVQLQIISREIYEMKSEKDSVRIPLDMRQLQQSLTREQERALHWQQLYLSERRQREKERESEEWEDERDRDRWEEERIQADRMECLQKLMSTNLTTLTQHVLKWNVSVFDDFANLSMLMSTVAELQQSVVSSVHRVWKEAEEVMGRGEKKKGTREGDERMWENFPNKEDLTSYFRKLVNDVKEEVEEVLKDEPELKFEETMLKGEFSHGKKPGNKSKSKKIFGKFVNVLKKTKKSVKKLGKKVVGFLGKIHDAWRDRQKWMAKMGSFFSKNQQRSSSDAFEKLCTRSSKDWLSIDMDGNSWVNVRSECIGLIRSEWQKKVQESPCKLQSAICSLKDKEITDKNDRCSQYLKELFRLKKVIPGELTGADAKYSSISTGMLDEFLQKYASIGIVLGVDVKWAECSMKWWSDALYAIQTKTTHTLKKNKCHWVEIPFSYSDSTSGFEIIDSLLSWKHDFHVNDFRYNFNVRNEKSFDNDDEDDRYKKNYEGDEDEQDHEKYKDKVLIVELVKKANDSLNRTSSSKDDSDKMNLSGKMREKDQASHHHENSKRSINIDPSGEWQFKKAEDREFQRKEEHRSDWLFDRAEARREMSDNSKNKKDRKRDPNWFLEQGNEREKIRNQDRQADWVFERANNRKEHQRKRNGKKWFDKKKLTKKDSRKHKKYNCEDF